MTPLASYWAKSAARSGMKGESLTTHLHAAYVAARVLAQRIGTLPCLHPQLREPFWRVVELAAVAHDAGKLADGFQAMVKGETQTWGQRHEALSVGFVARLIDNQPSRDWVSLAVATHHRHIGGTSDGCGKSSLSELYQGMPADEFAEAIGRVDPHATAELLNWITHTVGLPSPQAKEDAGATVIAAAHEELTRLLENWRQPVPAAIGLSAVLLQGAVTLADHLSSGHGHLHTSQPLDTRFRNGLIERLASGGRSIRPHQHQADQTEGHLILRAPTGSGKTEAGLLWAVGQLERIRSERGGTPRLFYTLPYLASINAMADRLSEQLPDRECVGVAHSRAGSYHLAAAIEPADQEQSSGTATDHRAMVAAARKALSRAAATRLFRETVRVGTPYQLLRGALAGPVHASVLLDAANSVFLLDELHAYDSKRLGFILAAMRFWEELGGRVGVLSATMPDALTSLVGQALNQPVTIIDGHGPHTPARHRISLRERHLTDQATIDEIRQRLLLDRSVLVVANNVGHAQDIFASLAPTATQVYGDDGAHLLHARFTRRDRNRIERAIRTRYGTTALHQGGLVVATQTIEVSLDLDCDVIHTSAAPLEALLQRFGRVNRLGTRPPTDVVTHQPEYKPRRKDGPDFADGVYDAGPTRHAWQILARHDGQPINERTTVDWLNEVYNSAWGQQWQTDVERNRELFAEYFLTFRTPFDDRSHLEEAFDTMFEGIEAILRTDVDEYQTALDRAPGGAGRLEADELLIPLPHFVRPRFDRRLRVHVVDAEYDPRTGFGQLHAATEPSYLAGEII